MVTSHMIRVGAMAETYRGRRPALPGEVGGGFTKEMLLQESGDRQMYPLKGRASQKMKTEFDKDQSQRKHSMFKKQPDLSVRGLGRRK